MSKNNVCLRLNYNIFCRNSGKTLTLVSCDLVRRSCCFADVAQVLIILFNKYRINALSIKAWSVLVHRWHNSLHWNTTLGLFAPLLHSWKPFYWFYHVAHFSSLIWPMNLLGCSCVNNMNSIRLPLPQTMTRSNVIIINVHMHGFPHLYISLYCYLFLSFIFRVSL